MFCFVGEFQRFYINKDENTPYKAIVIVVGAVLLKHGNENEDAFFD